MVPKTWKACQEATMKKFLTDGVEDEVLTAWRGLKLKKGGPMKKNIEKFWDLHLKACVFEDIGFQEKSNNIV